MSQSQESNQFACKKCNRDTPQETRGTRHRNHCPFCLWSLHVAETSAQHDRRSDCEGLMEPIAISTQRDGEWSLVHRCVECGVVRTNRIGGDDDSILLLSLALRPLANLPFPLESLHVEAMAKYREAQ